MLWKYTLLHKTTVALDAISDISKMPNKAEEWNLCLREASNLLSYTTEVQTEMEILSSRPAHG